MRQQCTFKTVIAPLIITSYICYAIYITSNAIVLCEDLVTLNIALLDVEQGRLVLQYPTNT